MPILNKDKCFVQQPVRLTVEVPATLPEDWLTSLYQLAAKQLGLDDQHRDEEGHTQTSYFIKDAEKHTGVFSDYTLKAKLIDSLKILYAAFTNDKVTDNQKNMIAFKLQEGAQNCTPGFHTRVEFAIQLLNLPENIDGLLAKTRVAIIDQIATVALKNDTQSVHGHNRFFLTAQTMGYGVRAIYQADSYINVGGVTDDIMERALTDGFASYYGLFGILTSLRDQLEALLREQGYKGRQETGFSDDECERFSELIKPFITMTDATLYDAHVDEERYKKTVFDIHWQNVKCELLKKLCDEKYIDLPAEETEVLAHLLTLTNSKALTALIPNAHELAHCLEFFSEWTIEQKAALVNTYLKDKSVAEQEAVLSVLESQAAPLTKQIKTQPEFRSRYFKVALQKNNAADVRAYIEQGADINAALSLLFSEEHKRDTLYWLYEHKNLIATITLDDMKAIIPDGKYKNKTIAEVLKSTKKGRQVLLENASFHVLFSEAELNKARDEKKSMVMPEGFFKRPDPLATQLGQYVAYGDLPKAEEILKKNPALATKLLTEKVTVMDYSGRKMKHKTAFQIALCAWDVKLNDSIYASESDPYAMGEMLAEYMMKEDVDRQYNELFPEGHQQFFDKQKPFDFSEIIQAITNSSKEEVQAALDLTQPNDTALWRAFEKFRVQFTELSKKETVWNPQHLLQAIKQYENHLIEAVKQYEKENNNPHLTSTWGAEDAIRLELFWRQVIGYIQRFLPANIAMDVAHGLINRVVMKYWPQRKFNFQLSGGVIFPLPCLPLAGLGYEYAARMYWGGAGRNEWLTFESGKPYKSYTIMLENVLQSKIRQVEKLCSSDRTHNLQAGV